MKEVHAIDRALAAISDAVTELLSTSEVNRFSKVHDLSALANALQRHRPAEKVDDVPAGQVNNNDNGHVGEYNYGIDGWQPIIPGVHRQMHPLRPIRVNDQADMNREILMLGQAFLESQAKLKPARPAEELHSLIDLRIHLKRNGEDIPKEINDRITQLLQEIGTPHAPDPVVHPVPLRGHQADAEGHPDDRGIVVSG
jgi:hypothetical protein